MTTTFDRLNKLEKMVLRDFCKDEHLEIENLDSKIDLLEIVRECSPVGFFTKPKDPNGLRLMKAGTNFKGGKVGARINDDKIETGYLIVIEDGFLSMFEGYTYEELWPKEIIEIETYIIAPNPPR